MKQIKYTLLLMLALLCSCTQEDKLLTEKGAPLELEITAEDLLPADKAQTRITEGGMGGYTTSFSDGDQIGITVVKGGNIVDGMNNIPYTYNSSTAKWTATSAKLFFYDDATYIAYYPYSATMNGKKTIAEIVAGFTPKEDQSDFATGYSPSCLMTATGAANAATKKLSLTFAHQMAMLELQFKQTLDNDPETDVMPDAGSTLTVTSGGQNYTLNAQSTRYRLMLKPGSTFSLNFTYSIEGVGYTYAATSLTMPAAGKYMHYDLKHKQSLVTVTLNTGNYKGALGNVSKVVINGYGYSRSTTKQSDNTYEIKIPVPFGASIPSSISAMDIYINDNLASAESLLISSTQVSINSSTATVTVTLSKGGMEGAGTSESDPYLVTTAAQLRGVGQDTSAKYKQTKNIDLSIYSNWSSVNDYSGIYDGGHNKISNLTCTNNGTGLFGKVTGTIKNVHIASGSVTRNGTAGGICEYVDTAGIIENCSNAATITGTVRGSGFFGGICGETHGKVLHCKNTGTISGKGEIFGGVVGWVNRGTLQYSYNAGKVEPVEPYHSSKSAGVGGVAGATYYGTYYLTYCYNIGTVKDYGDKEVASGGGGGTVQKGEIVGWTDNGQRVQYNWYKDGTKASGDGKIDTTNKKFNSPSDWPTYSAGTGDGWTSTHWKAFSNGEYPKLYWEE